MILRRYYDIRQAIGEQSPEWFLVKSRRVPRAVNRLAPEIERKAPPLHERHGVRVRRVLTYNGPEPRIRKARPPL